MIITKQSVLSYVKIILLSVLLAFNTQLFVVVNNFAPSGLSGVATMVQYKTGFSIGYMYLLINIPLCLFAFFKINRKFALRSFCFVLVYSFMYLYVQKLGLEQWQYNAKDQDTIYPVIISGLISGFGAGLIFRAGGSTGGNEIFSKYISKVKPNLNYFWITFTLNAIVAVTSFFVYAKVDETGAIVYNYKPVCLCMLYCFISSFTANRLIARARTACKVTIITPNADKLSEEILEKLQHSCTRLSATGSYSGKAKEMLICIINKHQLIELRNILKAYPETFSFSEVVNATYGYFRHIK